MKKIFILYFIGDIFIILLSLYVGKNWLINTQLGFISSFIIIYSSYYKYKKLIELKVKDQSLVVDEDDEEKFSFLKFRKSLSNTNHPKTSLYLLLKIFSYVFLILVFFILNRQNIFNPIAFIIGISIVPISSLFLWIFKK